MNIRRPFDQAPAAYLMASRTVTNAIDYACPIQRRKATGYSAAWWCAMAVIAIITGLIVWGQA